MSVTREPFGELPDGRKAERFVLRNKRGMRLECSDLGATVMRILAPDRDGRFENVNLGFGTPAEYLEKAGCLGALVGRYANRIRDGRFTLDGKEYRLARNFKGIHHLHGGEVGFHRRFWDAEIDDDADGAARVVFRRRSPAGEDNYPGNLDLAVAYTLTDDNEWVLEYSAVTDAPTPINLTQHAYFNLTGCRRDILAHEARIPADRYLVSNPADNLVTGEIAAVEGTPYDFRAMKPIERDLGRTAAAGYDCSYIYPLEGESPDAPRTPTLAAEIHEPESGRTLTAYTTEPAVHLYTGNSLTGDTGLDGVVYGRYMGFCLETQHYPDSVNHPEFPTTILRPGRTYRQTTVFRFGVR